MTVTHPDYAILAARIAVSNLHKQTKKQFSQVITDLYTYVNPVSVQGVFTQGTISNSLTEKRKAFPYDLNRNL